MYITSLRTGVNTLHIYNIKFPPPRLIITYIIYTSLTFAFMQLPKPVGASVHHQLAHRREFPGSGRTAGSYCPDNQLELAVDILLEMQV